MTDPKDPLVQKLLLAVQKQVRDDHVALNLFGLGVEAMLETDKAGRLVIKINDPVFPLELPVEQLMRAAEAISDQKKWGLLSRPGILAMATIMRDVAPESALTLYVAQPFMLQTGDDRAVTIGSEINGREIMAHVTQDRGDKRGLTQETGYIFGTFEIVPPQVLEIPNDRFFHVSGKPEDLNDPEGLGYFRKILEKVRDLDRPNPQPKPINRRWNR